MRPAARGLLAVLASILALTRAAGTATPDLPFKVVVNPTNPITAISKSTLSDLFLKKVTAWEGGLTVMPVDQLETSAIRAAFSTRIHGKSVLAVRQYWQKELSRSGGKLPPLHKSEADTLTYVKVHAGAVGYVARDTDAGKLKVVPVE
jgi:ABC-type phosphate transport system substrate-binding protein